MREQIIGAQAALEADIELLRHAASMSGDGTALAVAQGQMARLTGLQHRIEHIQGGGLAAIRAEVMASVAASQTLAQQARSTAASAQAAEVALHAASAEAHRVTGDFVHDFYERKIFDKYLDFASPEDERAYREREEANRRAIEQARAEGTPEGELRALQLSRAQLLDAGAHGASRSPDFHKMLSENEAARRPLEALISNTAPSRDAVGSTEIAPQPQAGDLVTPDIVATLRATGTVMAAADHASHGLTQGRPIAIGGGVMI